MKLLSLLQIAFCVLLSLSLPTTSRAQEVWSVGENSLSLNVGEAKFIRLQEMASAVFLSNPAVAEIDLQSTQYLYIVGQQIGKTTLFVLGEDNREVMSATIEVGIDVRSLTRAANRAIGGGGINVQAAEGAIFLTGLVRSDEDVEMAERVVAALVGERNIVINGLALADVPQVNLQVRIAEVSRSISEDLGISLTASGGNGRRSFSGPRSGPDGGFSINVSNGTRNINLVLDALARNGLVTILSEPNLTARSGENATFLAGGRVPYPNRNAEGEVSYSLEPIGVELEFEPVVRERGQIQLRINTRVRDIDEASTSAEVPSLLERSATTTVELGSGQSFAIAGMFRANSSQSISGFPGLANVPVIGALFRSSRFARGETELVIIVTPYLVKPGAASDFVTPVDRISPVSGGIEQAVTGQMQRAPVQSARTARVLRKGGFVLE